MTQMESKIKKRIEHRGILMLLVLISFVSASSFLIAENANADQYSSLSAVTDRMTELKTYFPAGKYWNGGKTESQLIAAANSSSWSQSAFGVTSSGCKHNSKTACSCHEYKCTSNSFAGGTQCYGFGRWMGYLLWPEYGNPQNCKGWTKVSGSAVSSVTLEPGDIICQGNTIHTAIVYQVSGTTVSVAEVWGNNGTKVGGANHGSAVGCRIAWGYYNGNSNNKAMSTILSLVQKAGGYILKHPAVTASLPEEPQISGATYPKDLSNGQSFGLRGTISCKYTLTEIRAIVVNRSTGNEIFNKAVTPNKTSYSIGNPTSEPINSTLKFGDSRLNNSYCNYSVYAKYTKNGATVTKQVIDYNFTVGNPNELKPTSIELTDPEGIVLSTLTYYGYNDDSKTLNVQAWALPYDAGNTEVVWASSNPNVLSLVTSEEIDGGGTLGTFTINGVGKSIVTATSKADGNVKASFTYNYFISSISLSSTSISLSSGETRILNATIVPSIANSGSLTWSSSNTDVVSVNENGVVTGKTAGSAVVYAKANDGSEKQASCEVTVLPASGSCGERAMWSYNNGTLTISGSGKITDFANIEARPWHSLASDITTVIIEPGITHIGEYCFESFTSMTSVTIPNTVTYMAYRAFYNCDTLQNISLPNLLTGIGSVCFMECGNLQSINMPDTVTTIGYYTFKSCTSLADVHLSTQLSAITYGSFADCSSLSSIVIPDSVTKIGYRAFEGCQGLRSITIPASVSAIDVTTDVGAENAYGLNTAFSGCSNVTIYCFDGSDAQHYAAEQGIVCVVAGGKCGDSLTWRKDGKELIISGTGAMYDYTYDTAPWGKDITSVSFSEGVTSIGYCAFYGCTELRSVSGHPSITSIGPESFKCCSSLSKFNIGSNVKTVNSQAFAWCSSLTYVSIPASVEYIGEGAFCYCESLETIIVDSTNTHYYTDDSALLGKDGTLVAYLTTRTAESYTIPDGIKRIDAWCFANAKNIKTLTVPSSVVEFGHGAVENSGLITIKCFEDSTAHTFAIENNIQYVLMDSPLINPDLVLPAGTKYIEEEAFAGIAAKRVRLPEGITEIEANAFANCPNLKQIYIPEGCEWIATNAFSGVSNLTIYGASGSYAEWYASRRGFEFVKVQ